MENTTPETVDQYIAGFPAEVGEKMSAIRQVIHDTVPDVAEKISCGMATFYKGKKRMHFAGQKRHIGFYPAPATIEAFKDELSGYVTTKGGVQFPYSKPLPLDLITKMIAFVFKG